MGGAWCFENSQGKIVEYLTFEEFLGLWRNRLRKKWRGIGTDSLILIMDSCFSGHWIEKAKSLWKDDDGMLLLMASSRATEQSWEGGAGVGGLYTQWLLSQNSWDTLPSKTFDIQNNGIWYSQHSQHLVMCTFST